MLSWCRPSALRRLSSTRGKLSHVSTASRTGQATEFENVSRLVLALLIAADGRPVPTSSLIDGVWGAEVIPTARKALHGYVHHLRSELGDALITETDGYSFQPEGEVDAKLFTTALQTAAELAAVDPQGASVPQVQRRRQCLGC